jgi:hypothetical protein
LLLEIWKWHRGVIWGFPSMGVSPKLPNGWVMENSWKEMKIELIIINMDVSWAVLWLFQPVRSGLGEALLLLGLGISTHSLLRGACVDALPWLEHAEVR